jgi:hypothetical protein
MPKPNIFISHCWDFSEEYHRLINTFDEYGFAHRNYSVPSHDPSDAAHIKEIEDALREHMRLSNYFIIPACMASNTRWCQLEVAVAREYKKPILSFRPLGYTGGIPPFISEADNQGGPIGFHTPPIIRKICAAIAVGDLRS